MKIKHFSQGNNGFGFTIHQSNAGQRIKTVMDRSRCAYLMEGDLIVQVCEYFMNNMDLLLYIRNWFV